MKSKKGGTSYCHTHSVSVPNFKRCFKRCCRSRAARQRPLAKTLLFMWHKVPPHRTVPESRTEPKADVWFPLSIGLCLKGCEQLFG